MSNKKAEVMMISYQL